MIGNWIEAAKVYRDRRIAQIFFLGFVSGLPLPLTMGTLSLWMAEAGVNKATIGAFALVGLPYTLKFIWSPLMDTINVPVLGAFLGRRRAWMIVTQFALCLALVGLGSTNPIETPFTTAFLAMIVAFCSSSQDIVIDAFRVEMLDKKSYGAGAATIVFGYRIGMLIGGAGALYLASSSSWFTVYSVMAGLMVVGMITVLMSKEPKSQTARVASKDASSWLKSAVIEPFSNFAERKNWLLILLFVTTYKLGDAFLGNMMNPFFVDMGFSKIEIANVTKVFGLIATLMGAFIGGLLTSRYGIMKALLYCGVIHMVANLIFVAQAQIGHDVSLLMVTIAVENITGGMATTALVAYLSSLCNQKYTATQYALLSSFTATGRSILSSGAGALATTVSWPIFFVLTSFIAIPAIAILLWLMRTTDVSMTEGFTNEPASPA